VFKGYQVEKVQLVRLAKQDPQVAAFQMVTYEEFARECWIINLQISLLNSEVHKVFQVRVLLDP
jgi:hypothetical protein